MGTESQLIRIKIDESIASDAWTWCCATFDPGHWHSKISFVNSGTESFFFESSADATLFRLRWAGSIVEGQKLAEVEECRL